MSSKVLSSHSLGETESGELPTGMVLAGRFAVQGQASRGGMGVVYQGTDLHTQESVAIKVATAERHGSVSRFAQEVAVLSRLSHPGIVRYIGCGETPRGTAFLVMEWLEGETLAERLTRASLTVEESLAVVRRACEGLIVAHSAGVVHRDLKPSNLFLVEGDPQQLKVIDFGVAQHHDVARTITQSGTVLGTVGYMSPEQALGARGLDARSDVFSLGCVLFECLTGRAAFSGRNPVAILAKVLQEEPPPPSDARPELGEPLSELVTRMLSKDPAGRPADAAAVLHALANIQPSAQRSRPSAPPPAGLTAMERRIVAVVLGSPRARDLALLDASTEAASDEPAIQTLRDLTRRFGAEPMFLRDGTILVVLSGPGTATDQSAQAARCALLLQRARPSLRLSVATGRAETTGPIPIGGAIDRATELVTTSDEPAAGVAIDELTAALLERSFFVQRDHHTLAVIEERRDQPVRLLLGKATPFVGRDKELALLESTLSECLDDSVARVVLVTGAPGGGKSRLRHEWMARVRERADVRVWMASADPLGARSAFVLVRQLVRRAAGLREGDPAAEQHAALRSYVATRCSADDAGWVADFLSELIGAPSSERPSPELRAARNDPQIMSVWLRRAFAQWLAAECAAQPLVLVLEDLHWGDPASVTYLGEALRALADRPLFLLALARPEIHETFPRLWANTELQTIALGRLTPRAAERLVHAVLGKQLDASALARVVERADGNPFHLEELIRRAADGDHESLPETVLALVESRLERLDPDARRIVRAASLFGETFWTGGLRHVLGTTGSAHDLDAYLHALLEEELFSASPESRFVGEREYTFRHGLLRDAAYSMLTDSDRRSGHALAGAWLERLGEKDALTLATHFELGAQRARAVAWLLAASRAAVDGGNVDDAVAVAQRGLTCGATGAERGQLHLVCAEAAVMRGSWQEVVTASREARELLPKGSTLWFAANAAPLLAATFLGDVSVTAEAVGMVMNVPLPEEPTGPLGMAIFWVSQALMNVSQTAAADALLERAEALARTQREADVDPVYRMWLMVTHSFNLMLRCELGPALAKLEDTRKLAEQTGSKFGLALASMYRVAALSQTGHAARTAEAARSVFAISDPTGLRVTSDWASYFLALAGTRAGSSDLEQRVIAPLRVLAERADKRLGLLVHNILALALLERGELEEAEREGALAAAGALFPLEHATVLGVQAQIELRLGRPESALAACDRGLEAASQAIFPWTGSMLHLGRARALHALGRNADACAAIAEARARLQRIANTLQDAELRDSFLTNVDAHARTLLLAREWLGEPSV